MMEDADWDRQHVTDEQLSVAAVEDEMLQR